MHSIYWLKLLLKTNFLAANLNAHRCHEQSCRDSTSWLSRIDISKTGHYFCLQK